MSFSYNSASQLIQLTQTNTAYNYRESNNKTGIYAPNWPEPVTSPSTTGTSATNTNGNLTNDVDVPYGYDMDETTGLVSAVGTRQRRRA
jgi:hypothetical protein